MEQNNPERYIQLSAYAVTNLTNLGGNFDASIIEGKGRIDGVLIRKKKRDMKMLKLYIS